jgi:hypothetical protein
MTGKDTETFTMALHFNQKHLPPCHQESPRHKDWISRVEQLETEGLDRSDAQGIADMEIK